MAGVQFNSKFSMKVGRQELNYDDARILDNLDWAAQARSYDALKFAYQDSLMQVDGVLAFNLSGEIPEPVKLFNNIYNSPGGFSTLGGDLPNYKNLQLLWFKRQIKKSNFRLILDNIGWQMPDSTVSYLLTTGFNSKIVVNTKIDINGSLYYQIGEDIADRKTEAYLAALNLGFKTRSSFRYKLGFNYVSGSEAWEGANQSSSFDPLFGTHHKFYGLMDYFYVGSPHNQSGKTIGLWDYYLGGELTLREAFKLLLTVHGFSSSVSIINQTLITENLNPHLGTDLDLVFNYKYSADINFKTVYSQYVGNFKYGNYKVRR
ncbi:alginate export family protein [Fulvivirga sediminis]|uniref:Alginate export domain-containing protein n=1 Tax=Fulvivirga sediminis TaxID=2803949 RepID=A0A937K1B1_9BACT|nr:alginate export family protein [Fulvivirga sediminis]MBL3657160.1 hypothetical protein [Fulvivirga sediminis]